MTSSVGLRLAFLLALAACVPAPGDSSAGVTSSGEASTSTSAASGSASMSSTSGAGSASASASGSSSTDPTSGSASSAASDPSTDDSSSCNFICEPDMGPPGRECDFFDPKSCPEGQKCTFFGDDQSPSWDYTKCVPITGDGKLGEPCKVELPANSGLDDCAAQHMCWDADEGGEGHCVALCGGSWDKPTCPEGQNLVFGRTLCLCFPSCDPLAPECAEDELCTYNNDWSSFICTLDVSEGMSPPGTPCEFDSACNPGSACVDANALPTAACQGASGCCAPYCDLNLGAGADNPACAPLAGEVPEILCQPALTMPAPGLEHVGLCALP